MTLEEMIEDNRKKLIESCQKVLELAQNPDNNTIQNTSYIEQHASAVFQYAEVLGQQIRQRRNES